MLCRVFILDGGEEMFILKVFEGLESRIIFLLSDEVVGLVDSMEDAERSFEGI